MIVFPVKPISTASVKSSYFDTSSSDKLVNVVPDSLVANIDAEPSIFLQGWVAFSTFSCNCITKCSISNFKNIRKQFQTPLTLQKSNCHSSPDQRGVITSVGSETKKNTEELTRHKYNTDGNYEVETTLGIF